MGAAEVGRELVDAGGPLLVAGIATRATLNVAYTNLAAILAAAPVLRARPVDTPRPIDDGDAAPLPIAADEIAYLYRVGSPARAWA
jgi:hypothetical protein